MDNNYIFKWDAPKWHVDFGNPQKELVLLKKACLFLIEINNNFTFELDCYEEGYMRVVIFENKEWGEIVVTDIENNKLGIFKSNDKEIYFYV
ncbi:MAG: hypothetical protein JKY19_16255 [Alcanivoracaceae bacterium]|nr:hypothetical protein [Alcanivoracaceae bacterium]